MRWRSLHLPEGTPIGVMLLMQVPIGVKPTLMVGVRPAQVFPGAPVGSETGPVVSEVSQGRTPELMVPTQQVPIQEVPIQEVPTQEVPTPCLLKPDFPLA